VCECVRACMRACLYVPVCVCVRFASEVDVKKIITKSRKKTYDSDPPSTWLLKKCLYQRLPLLNAIINRPLADPVKPWC